MFRTGTLPPHFQEEFASLQDEGNPEIRAEGMLSLARRLENRGDTPAAQQIYADLSQNPSTPAAILRRVGERLNVLNGTGPVVTRAESLGRSLAHHATEPVGLASMLGAGLAFRAVRLGMLSRLAATPTSGFLTRGLGARALANLVGFSAEVSAFSALGRVGNAALGREQDWSLGGLGRELASGAIVLGSLKIFGNAFGALGSRARIGQPVLAQAGMFSGILTGHQIEEWLRLRPEQNAANALVEGLGTLIQFNAAGRLAHGIAGVKFRRMEQELDLRTDSTLAARRPSLNEVLNNSIDPQLATSPALPRPRNLAQRIGGALRNILLSPMWMMMGAGGIGGFGPGPRIYAAPERGSGGRGRTGPPQAKGDTRSGQPRTAGRNPESASASNPTPQTGGGSLLDIYLTDFDSALQKRQQGLSLSSTEESALRDPQLRELFIEREQLSYRQRPDEARVPPRVTGPVATSAPTPSESTRTRDEVPSPPPTAPSPPRLAKRTPPRPAVAPESPRGSGTVPSPPVIAPEPPSGPISSRLNFRTLREVVLPWRTQLKGIAELDLSAQVLRLMELRPHIGSGNHSLTMLAKAIHEFVLPGRVQSLVYNISNIDVCLRRWSNWSGHFAKLERMPSGDRMAYARDHLLQTDGTVFTDKTLSAYIRWGNLIWRNQSRFPWLTDTTRSHPVSPEPLPAAAPAVPPGAPETPRGRPGARPRPMAAEPPTTRPEPPVAPRDIPRTLRTYLRKNREEISALANLDVEGQALRLIQLRDQLGLRETSLAMMARAIHPHVPGNALRNLLSQVSYPDQILKRWPDWEATLRSLVRLPRINRLEYARRRLRRPDETPYANKTLEKLIRWGTFLWRHRGEIPSLSTPVRTPSRPEPPRPAAPPPAEETRPAPTAPAPTHASPYAGMIEEIRRQPALLEDFFQGPSHQQVLRIIQIRAQLSSPTSLYRVTRALEIGFFPDRMGSLPSYVEKVDQILRRWSEWAPHLERLSRLPSNKRHHYAARNLRKPDGSAYAHGVVDYITDWGIFLWNNRARIPGLPGSGGPEGSPQGTPPETPSGPSPEGSSGAPPPAPPPPSPQAQAPEDPPAAVRPEEDIRPPALRRPKPREAVELNEQDRRELADLVRLIAEPNSQTPPGRAQLIRRVQTFIQNWTERNENRDEKTLGLLVEHSNPEAFRAIHDLFRSNPFRPPRHGSRPERSYMHLHEGRRSPAPWSDNLPMGSGSPGAALQVAPRGRSVPTRLKGGAIQFPPRPRPPQVPTPTPAESPASPIQGSAPEGILSEPAAPGEAISPGAETPAEAMDSPGGAHDFPRTLSELNARLPALSRQEAARLIRDYLGQVLIDQGEINPLALGRHLLAEEPQALRDLERVITERGLRSVPLFESRNLPELRGEYSRQERRALARTLGSINLGNFLHAVFPSGMPRREIPPPVAQSQLPPREPRSGEIPPPSVIVEVPRPIAPDLPSEEPLVTPTLQPVAIAEPEVPPASTLPGIGPIPYEPPEVITVPGPEPVPERARAEDISHFLPLPPVPPAPPPPSPIPPRRLRLENLIPAGTDLPLSDAQDYLEADPARRRHLIPPTLDQWRAIQRHLNDQNPRDLTQVAERDWTLRAVERILRGPQPQEIEEYLAAELALTPELRQFFRNLSPLAREGLYLVALALHPSARPNVVAFLENPVARGNNGLVTHILETIALLHDQGARGYERGFLPKGRDGKFLEREIGRLHSLYAEYQEALRISLRPDVDRVWLSNRLNIDWSQLGEAQREFIDRDLLPFATYFGDYRAQPSVEVDILYRIREGGRRIVEVKSGRRDPYSPDFQEESRTILQVFRHGLLVRRHRLEGTELTIEANNVSANHLRRLRNAFELSGVPYVISVRNPRGGIQQTIPGGLERSTEELPLPTERIRPLPLITERVERSPGRETGAPIPRGENQLTHSMVRFLNQILPEVKLGFNSSRGDAYGIIQNTLRHEQRTLICENLRAFLDGPGGEALSPEVKLRVRTLIAEIRQEVGHLISRRKIDHLFEIAGLVTGEIQIQAEPERRTSPILASILRHSPELLENLLRDFQASLEGLHELAGDMSLTDMREVLEEYSPDRLLETTQDPVRGGGLSFRQILTALQAGQYPNAPEELAPRIERMIETHELIQGQLTIRE